MKTLTLLSTLLLVFVLAGCNTSHKSNTLPQRVGIQIKTDTQHGKLGPDGNWHDAFLPADFHLVANQPNTITIHNYDSAPHSLTSPALKLNLIIPANGSATVTITPKPGRYLWMCMLPCDPWAMSHDGYMRGYITAT